MAVVGGILFVIVGVICGMVLTSGSTGFWLWFFALGSEVVNLFLVSAFSEEIKINFKSITPTRMNIIGTLFWGIGLLLFFSDVKGFAGALFCVVCLFIAPYLIVASLDALFDNSVGAMFAIGIAKLASSILAYTGGLRESGNTSAGIHGKSVAYIAILLLLVLLFWIRTISRKIEASNKEKRKQRIRNEEQRKISCSTQLIFDAGKNDKNAVLNLLKQGADVNYEDSYGKTPLSNAVINGNADMVSLLLENGADIECKSKYKGGLTPLQRAFTKGNKEIIKLLIEKGANVNVYCKDKPLLHTAIENDDKSLVELLIENGANTEYKDKKLYSPLFFAADNGKTDMILLLLEKGADIECKGRYESTPLFVAVCNENLELVSLLLEKGADIECENEDGLTPLSVAATNGDLDMVSFLLEEGANIEHEEKNGMTPLDRAILGRSLEYAAMGKNKEMISFLIDKGADIKHEDKFGMTPLDLAIQIGNKETISLLIDKGADVNRILKENGIETTALFSAIDKKNAEIISLLLEKGADVNLTIMNGFSVLQKAITDKNKKLVSLFLDAGAEINRNSNEIETALQDAIITKNYEPEILSHLIERGADVNLESAYNGFTPLAFAIGQDNKDAALLLLKNGADPNKKSSKAGSPLMIAFQAVNKEMCSLLMENGANPADVLCAATMMPTTEVAQFFLDRGADVNCKGLGDKTPLMCAILFSNKEMVLFLISKGADVNSEVSEPSEKNAARTPLEAAIVTGNAEMVSLLITYGADVNYKTKNGNTPLLFAALHQKTELVPLLKEAGAVASVSGKDTQNLAATSHVGSDLQDDSSDFNAALVALSKIIAKNGVEILSAENSQKLKALVSDLIPLGNETARTLKQALPCGFTQIIQDANGGSDSKKETACKESVGKIVAKTGLMKAAAVAVVKLVALSVGWNLEDFALS